MSTVYLTKPTNVNQIENITLTSKRMDGARSTLIRSAGVFAGNAHMLTVLLNIINAYVGHDRVQEEAYDQTLRVHMLPKFLNSTPIYIVEARDSRFSQEEIHSAITQVAEKELSDALRYPSTLADNYLTQDYYEKRPPSFLSIFYPENVLLARDRDQIVGFLIAKITQCPKDKNTLEYYVAFLAIDSSHKGNGIGTQLMLTAMSKAHALRMSLALSYSSSGLRGKTRSAFYESFTPKFGIPMYKIGEEEDTSTHFPVWNLEGVKGLSYVHSS
jgi:ribosomal protein S18 acetylase RimI-like enzyme